MVKLSIIILNYKTKDLTLKCLESIAKIYKKNLDNKELEIILVDNNSEDDSVRDFKASKINSFFKLIESKKNLGFGGGNNLGAKNSNGKYLLFLNSDTEIRDEGFEKMIDFMDKNPQVGILGAKLFFPDGKIQRSVGQFYNLTNLTLMLVGGERFGLLRESPKNIKEVDWVSGACLMIRADLFKKLGLFDEKIFMYVEDMEICYRAKLKGLRTYFFPDISLLHKERGSSNKTFAILNIYKGINYFYKKHMPSWKYRTAIFLLKTKALAVKNLGKISHNNYYIQTYGQALDVLK